IFAKFKGGKAVATSAGVLLCYQPLIFILLLIIFICLLLTTKMVSLSSMLTAITAVIASIIERDTAFCICISILAAFVIYRHRTNIQRILNKTEPKVNFLSKK